MENTIITPEVATVAKPNALKVLFKAAKKSPVKTTAVVVGTGVAVAGAVYGVKKFRAYRAAKATESVEDNKEA